MFEQMLDTEPYILNDNNMLTYLKYKVIKSKNVESKNVEYKNYSKDNNQLNKNSLFIPKEEDTLFWCYYIMSAGDSSYEMMNVKNSLIAKQLKINYVDKIRTNKQTIKIYKFDTITNIENNLANENNINIKSVMSLCAIDKINIKM